MDDLFDKSREDLNLADVGQVCKYCDGTGETFYCHNQCPPERVRLGCGDCWDECNFCLGFGKRWPVTAGYWCFDTLQ